MRKKKKYLPLYYKWMELGGLPKSNGLCDEFGSFISQEFDPLFELMLPDHHGIMSGYWAKEDNASDLGAHFGPLRQTIVLFMAAMNGEL